MPEKPEITAGLKAAIERGYSLELAIQSFINSGYNRQDVLDSARNINIAVISKIPVQPHELVPQPPKTPQTQYSQPKPIQPQTSQLQTIKTTQYSQTQTSQFPQSQPPKTLQPQSQTAPNQTYSSAIQTRQTQQPPQKNKSNLGLIILLTGLLVILLGTLALFLFAKEQVLAFFSKLGF